MRIMSVDDSEATRKFIKGAVDVLGFEFIEAADGKEGLEVLEKENGNVDLIISTGKCRLWTVWKCWKF